MFWEIERASGKLRRPGCRMFWEIDRAWARRGGTKPPQSNPEFIIGGSAFSVSRRAWNTLRQGAKNDGATTHLESEKLFNLLVYRFGAFLGVFFVTKWDKKLEHIETRRKIKKRKSYGAKERRALAKNSGRFQRKQGATKQRRGGASGKNATGVKTGKKFFSYNKNTRFIGRGGEGDFLGCGIILPHIYINLIYKIKKSTEKEPLHFCRARAPARLCRRSTQARRPRFFPAPKKITKKSQKKQNFC